MKCIWHKNELYAYDESLFKLMTLSNTNVKVIEIEPGIYEQWNNLGMRLIQLGIMFDSMPAMDASCPN